MGYVPDGARRPLDICIGHTTTLRDYLMEVSNGTMQAKAVIAEAFLCQAMGCLRDLGGAEYAARRLYTAADRMVEDIEKPTNGGAK